MMGAFGGYTRWAVVFLIIFVLFFLLCPNYSYGGVAGGKTTTVSHYDTMSYDAYGYGVSGSPTEYGTYGEPESSP